MIDEGVRVNLDHWIESGRLRLDGRERARSSEKGRRGGCHERLQRARWCFMIATFQASSDMGKTQEKRGDDDKLTTVNYGGEEQTEVAGGKQQ